MVLQRDTKLKIWGWASKNEKVTVRFAGRNFSTKAGTDGKWFVWLPPMKAGGPFEMTIRASNTITLKNILMGDVWFCSGQSNMVHYMELHKERYAAEIASADYPQIRQFLIPTTPRLQGPAEDLTKGNWKPATARDIGRFSVVAYFFAKKLHEKYQVPIGIINASVGGTPIEAWTSEEGLKEFPELINTVSKNKDTAYVNTITRSIAAAARTSAARKSEDLGMTGSVKWYDTTYVPKNWRTINIPGYWEDQGIKDLHGVVWYRKEFDLPASMTAGPAKIALGRIVDADFLYVNGKLVGNTTYQYPQRRYQVPSGLLKPGKNILVVRVLNTSGKGGFVPDKPYYLTSNGETIDLKGYWQYKVGEVYQREGNPGPQFSAQNQPSALFNGMASPVTPYAIKGMVWYQGESNSGRAAEYKKLLPALINDWRQKWNQGDAPFLYVQLPNYMNVSYSPSESGWALLREAQLQTLRVPNTAMAVAIDLGEWNDIHPGNKKPIGERLALAAQHISYHDSTVVYSGPIFQSAEVNGNKIVLHFSHVGGGLISIDGEDLSQFAIAGADKKFTWAKAKIENNTVVVWSDAIAYPAYVRYAWADNPDAANLYNKEGLPASPFRTDQ
jgi:sialate O-acetylesterase